MGEITVNRFEADLCDVICAECYNRHSIPVHPWEYSEKDEGGMGKFLLDKLPECAVCGSDNLLAIGNGEHQ